jgi:hypothetical protein
MKRRGHGSMRTAGQGSDPGCCEMLTAADLSRRYHIGESIRYWDWFAEDDQFQAI